VTNKQRVASRGAERTGLTPEQIRDVEAAFLADHKDRLANGRKIAYPDRIYRKVRERPLLVVHLLEMLPVEKMQDCRPVVAWSISFPETAIPEKRVAYIVNTTWLRENEAQDLDEDEMEGDLE